jgi:hypothetical protein
MEVPFVYFLIAQVPLMIKSKTEGAKNKVCKPQGARMHLTLFFFFEINIIKNNSRVKEE